MIINKILLFDRKRHIIPSILNYLAPFRRYLYHKFRKCFPNKQHSCGILFGENIRNRLKQLGEKRNRLFKEYRDIREFKEYRELNDI